MVTLRAGAERGKMEKEKTGTECLHGRGGVGLITEG